MRSGFIQELSALARKDKRIVLLTGDLGYTVIEPFAEEFPDRFYNVGVAEQNMVGIATGLAEAGWIPFVYSIATFACLRPYEFIRNGPVWHKLPVRIVGVGDGMEYGSEGLSHYALEDVGLMRLQPGMKIIVPVDSAQARTVLRKTWDLPGPIYYRLSKREVPVPELKGKFSLGKLNILKVGRRVLLLTMGGLANQAMTAARTLKSRRIEAGVGVVASVAPAPMHQLQQLVQQYKLVVTIEGHYVSGGLGSLVAEIIAKTNPGCQLRRCGVTNIPRIDTGKEPYLWQKHQLSAAQLASAVVKWL